MPIHHYKIRKVGCKLKKFNLSDRKVPVRISVVALICHLSSESDSNDRRSLQSWYFHCMDELSAVKTSIINKRDNKFIKISSKTFLFFTLTISSIFEIPFCAISNVPSDIHYQFVNVISHFQTLLLKKEVWTWSQSCINIQTT